MTERALTPDAGLKDTIYSFDRAFSGGHLDKFSEFFADDAQLLIHEQETITGKEAIEASFRPVFEGFDTSAYEPSYEVVDVHGDLAYVLASFDEVLRPKDGTPSVRISGRVVQFWRREPGGEWRIVSLLTARSAPDEVDA